jgi:hypothetical protein
MSDYKEVETVIDITQKDILLQALGLVCQGEIEENVQIKNKWSHTRQVDICIREKQLPADLQGFGDVGIVMKNGKYTFVGISQQDSHYMDSAKGLKEGTFTNNMNGYMKDIENAYGVCEVVRDMEARIPGISIQQPTGIEDSEDARAWGARFSIDESMVAKLGVRIG